MPTQATPTKKLTKVVAFSDLHAHNYKQFSHNYGLDRLAACMHVVDVIFAHTNNIGANVILFCGDWYDSQRIVPSVVVNETFRVLKKNFEQYPHITLYAISGNHDDGSKATFGSSWITALTHLDENLENFRLLDGKAEQHGGLNIVGVPYYDDASDLDQAFDLAISQHEATKYNIMLTHQTPKGTSLDSIEGFEADFDILDNKFDKFDFVLNGHIHARTEHSPSRITLGNPLHRDAQDVGKTKGFWEIDLAGTAHFISLAEHYPHIKVYEGFPDDLTEEEKLEYEGHYVLFKPQRVIQGDVEYSVTPSEFNSSLSHEALLTNFYKREHGDDKKLLTTALNIIK